MIALTANLMQDDLARYAAAGFDRSIGKPIDFHLLASAMAELMEQAMAPARAAPGGLEFDAHTMDAEIAAIRAAFTASLGPRLAELRSLIAAAAWTPASELAHQLRGAGGSFGYPGLSRCARQVELAASQADSAAAQAALAELMALDELKGKIAPPIMQDLA